MDAIGNATHSALARSIEQAKHKNFEQKYQ